MKVIFDFFIGAAIAAGVLAPICLVMRTCYAQTNDDLMRRIEERQARDFAIITAPQAPPAQMAPPAPSTFQMVYPPLNPVPPGAPIVCSTSGMITICR